MVDNESYWPNGFFDELVAFLDEDPEKESWSATLAEMSLRAAEELAADAIAEPRRAHSESAAQQAAFEARLEAQWGRALDLAHLVVHEALESGKWANDLRGPTAAARQDKFEALVRLHGKAIMTAREVLVLLRSGYSSGAFARWRTLHEVWVVFLVLTDGDAELSWRYLFHDVVESLKGQEEYEQTWEALGQEPPDWTAAEREQTRAQLTEEFGRTFLRDYGWAAPLFNDKAPKFKQLQERVELDHWRGYYRMASHGTHANPKGISWNVQSLTDADIAWAGPSNAGLVDPAQCSLIALAHVTAGLIAHAINQLPDSTDHLVLDQSVGLVQQQQILLLTDHAIKALVDVHEQQRADEEARADLISRAKTALRADSPMTAEDLSAELKIEPEALADALDEALTRGELLQGAYYRNRPDDLDDP